MNDTQKQAVAPIDDEVVAAMRRASAMTLPDDPSACGMKASAIRRRLWEAVLGGKGSLLAELQRVIGEVNLYLAEIPVDVLPEVGAEDEGKVLAVVGGEWRAVEMSTSAPATTYTGEVEVV